MASIRNHQDKWQARIIRKSYAPIIKSFLAKQDTERWAREIESDIDKGSYTNLALADRTTFSEVIERYIKGVIIKCRGQLDTSMQIDQFQRFLEAQNPMYGQVLNELRNGRKQTL